MQESPSKYMIVGILYPLGNGVAFCTHLTRLDNVYLQERNHRHCQQERHHEVDGDGDGEVLEAVVEHTFQCEEEREEDSTDTDGGQHHRHEVLTR